jgi:hypothetical protein
MKIFLAPLVMGTLALAGASPAVAQSKPLSDQGVSVGRRATRQPKEAVTSKRRRTRFEFGNKGWMISMRR